MTRIRTGEWANGIRACLSASGVQIYNNTVVDCADGTGIAVTDGIGGCVVRNNISHACPSGPYADSGTGTLTDHNSWQSPVNGADPMFADPSTSNYRTRSGSPCRDSGIAAAIVSTDKDGMARPQGAGWDIGAYEA